MPSNAIDKNDTVGYTFAVGNGSSSNYPSIYAQTFNATSGSLGTITSVQSGSGSITDSANHHWGEYVSTSIDPYDDLTFWNTGQYLPSGGESSCDSNVNTGCNWETQIFHCKKGSGYCP